jgi:predicted metal-dependent hydrolase
MLHGDEFGDSCELRTLVIGEQTLNYAVRRSERRRTVEVRVEPNKRVTVLMPSSASIERVEGIVRKRLIWIRRQQREFDALPPAPPRRRWVAGETHRYLGRQYRLKLCCGHERAVRMTGGLLVVTSPSIGETSEIRRLVTSWYRSHACSLLKARVEKRLAETTWLDFSPPPIKVRLLTRRWGSTTEAGGVTFNLDLVQLPLPCIDYVVAHELVHIKIPNHSRAFWQMLDRVMPDWRKWRDRLSRAEVT